MYPRRPRHNISRGLLQRDVLPPILYPDLFLFGSTSMDPMEYVVFYQLTTKAYGSIYIV
jgi:hypothetical protein